MKITCPECSSTFDVPEPLMGAAGRRVRCSACGHIWLQEPPEEQSAFSGAAKGYGGFRAPEGDVRIDPIPASLHPHPDDDAAPADAGRGGFAGDFLAVSLARLKAFADWGLVGRAATGFVLGAGALALLLATLGAAGLAPRALMPGAIALGAAPQQGAAPEGLEIQDVAATASPGGATVTGLIANTGEDPKLLPLLEITPVTAANKPSAQGHRVKLDQDVLNPGEGLEFTAEIPGESLPGARLRIRFFN